MLDDLYNRLSSVPRVTREILAIIVEKGKYETNYKASVRYGIIPEALERFMRISQKELLIEINILESENLISSDQRTVGERTVEYLIISGEIQNLLYEWMIGQKKSIRTLLNTMDFTILDE